MTDAPITPEEYALLVYRHKAGVRTAGTPEEEPFIALCKRFHAQFPPTPERIGWHEAGHAVVSHHLGYRVWWIERNDEWGDTRTDQQPPWFGDWALVKVAGYLAEERAIGNVEPREASEVAWMAERRFGYGPSERESFVESVEARALAILVENWDAVEKISQLVQAKPLVKMAELDTVLSGVAVRERAARRGTPRL